MDTSADMSRKIYIFQRRDDKKPALLTNLKKTISDDISCEKTHASRKLIALRVEKQKHEKKVERPRAKFVQRKTQNQKQRTILQEKLTHRAALAINIQRENNSVQRAGDVQQQVSQPGPVPGHFQRAQHNEMTRLQMLRQQNNGMEMTPEQTTQMDQATFPQSLLTNNSQVPKNIKTWGQLKQWVSSNSQASTGIDPNKLLTLQKLHFAQILSVQAKDSNRQNQGQGIMKISFQQASQGQVQNAQNLQPGQPGQPGNMPPMRPITAQDIHLARQKLGPQSQSYTDDQIRDILRNRQRQILIQTAHQRAQAQQLSANANMESGQNQPKQRTLTDKTKAREP